MPQGRHGKFGTIKLELDIISQVLIKVYHLNVLNQTTDMKKLPEARQEADVISWAVAFDPEATLPYYLTYSKKVRVWSRLLGQLAIIGHASDVTSNCCPKIKDVGLTTNSSDWLRDGAL
jgi:hypothetical protein